MRVITTYGVQCLIAGCRGSGAGQQALCPGRGMLHYAYQKLFPTKLTDPAGTTLPFDTELLLLVVDYIIYCIFAVIESCFSYS